MNEYKILIVEDDSDINDILNKILTNAGYSVTSAYSGTEGKLLLSHENFDLLIFDLMLPGMNGEDLINYTRETHTMPIIVISAKPGTDTRVNALRSGADDFIPKPFDHDEVLARVEAQLRRSHIFSEKKQTGNEIYCHKNCELNTTSMTAKIKGKTLELTALEYQLLLTLMKNPERVFTRDTLFHLCWKQDYLGTDNTVDVHISRIRNKIAEYDNEEYIKTIRGIGYRLAE